MTYVLTPDGYMYRYDRRVVQTATEAGWVNATLSPEEAAQLIQGDGETFEGNLISIEEAQQRFQVGMSVNPSKGLTVVAEDDICESCQ